MTSLADEEPEFVSGIDHPEEVAAAAAAAAVLTGTQDVPQPVPPLDGPVKLPGGYRRVIPGSGAEVVNTAWVRELNGDDEERISKARLKDNYDVWVSTLLLCGVESLGSKPPTQSSLESLVIGDRDYLLLEISRATYGNEINYEDVACLHCGELMSFTVHKDTDIPVHRLESVDDAEFEVKLRRDRVAHVRLPTGAEQVVMRVLDTEAEANTALITACVTDIQDPHGKVTEIAGDDDAVRKLGIADRQTLVDEMSKRMPGPQYNGVKFIHDIPQCGREVRLTVTLADLFRGL